MNKGNKEYKRENRHSMIEVREAENGQPVVEGYAVVFDTPSDGLPFTEIIERGALDGVVERSDVFALINHNLDRGVLARSKRGVGSLTLTVDSRGLRYSFTVPDTDAGRELAENLRRGEITESSFSFTVEEDEWTREMAGDEEHWTRRVKKIRELYDVSPVYNAAYSATSVDLRGRDAALEAARKAKDEAEAAAEWAAMEDAINI